MSRKQWAAMAIAMAVIAALVVGTSIPRFFEVPSNPAGAGPVPASAAASQTVTFSAETRAPSGVSRSSVDSTQLDPRVTQATIAQTIGISGWASRVRPPVDVTQPIKLRLMREHGYTAPPSAYELDHFIPLGVGGSSNLSNLWLEPIAEARLKDRDEALVHRKVTTGEWTLEQGQQYIRDRWRIYYTQ